MIQHMVSAHAENSCFHRDTRCDITQIVVNPDQLRKTEEPDIKSGFCERTTQKSRAMGGQTETQNLKTIEENKEIQFEILFSNLNYNAGMAHKNSVSTLGLQVTYLNPLYKNLYKESVDW